MQTDKIYFRMHKPFGVLSQMHTNDPKEGKKRFLSELFVFPDGTMPVGRLDEKSEGLLLLTTDGQFSDHVNRGGIEKEYWVQVDGQITAEAMDSIRKGVEIGIHGRSYLTKPCMVVPLAKEPDLPPADTRLRIGRHRPGSWLSICITEGKFRQVRKMTAAVGFPTLRLVRYRIGKLTLDGLHSGQVKPFDRSRDF